MEFRRSRKGKEGDRHYSCIDKIGVWMSGDFPALHTFSLCDTANLAFFPRQYVWVSSWKMKEVQSYRNYLTAE